MALIVAGIVLLSYLDRRVTKHLLGIGRTVLGEPLRAAQLAEFVNALWIILAIPANEAHPGVHQADEL